jgi:hypothetical protein
MTRQHSHTLVPRVEALEERCTSTVFPQPAANSLLVTTGSTPIAVHEMTAAGSTFVVVTGAGRSSTGQAAMHLSGPFHIGIAFQTPGVHQIDFFHARGTPGGDLLATAGSGPVMRTAAAAVRVLGAVIRSALAAGSRSDQLVLTFLPVSSASPHSLTTISAPVLVPQTVTGLRSHGPFLVGVVLPISPLFGFPTLTFAGISTGGLGLYPGASPDPFARGFIVPARSLSALFFGGFTPFTWFAFTNPFFNPFVTPLL